MLELDMPKNRTEACRHATGIDVKNVILVVNFKVALQSLYDSDSTVGMARYPTTWKITFTALAAPAGLGSLELGNPELQ